MFKRSLLFLLVLVSLLTLSALNPEATLSQSGYRPMDPETLRKEIDEFMDAGAIGYLMWQYSGELSAGDGHFENDPYSWFKNVSPGSEICAALKEKSAQYGPDRFIGVNIWSLAREQYSDGMVENNLSYLAIDCGVKVVRIFFFSGDTTVDRVQRVLDIANSHGIQLIVSLGNGNGDYDASTEPYIPLGADWYGSLFQTSGYLEHIQTANAALAGHPALYGFELANEAHCNGDANATDEYNFWVRTSSNLLSASKIGIGQAASHPGAFCDNPEENFPLSNQQGAINITSGHYYDADQKALNLRALEETKKIGKSFYVGEAGGEGSVTGGSGEYPIPCNATKEFDDPNYPNAELHDLRPYGANPCDGGVGDITMMCGNDLITKQEIEIKFPEGLVEDACILTEEDELTEEEKAPYDWTAGSYNWEERIWDCTFEREWDGTQWQDGTAIKGAVEVLVDLSDAFFPIMGNTEIVTNKNVPPEDSIDFAQRMNNYVSWFLNGAVFGAFERPIEYNQDEVTDKIQCKWEWVNSVGDVVENPDSVGDLVGDCVPVEGQVSVCSQKAMDDACNGLNATLCGISDLTSGIPILGSNPEATCTEVKKHIDVVNPDLTLEENLGTYVNQVVNYSGPLNKLLPRRILDHEKILEAEDGKLAQIRHNQIIGCNNEHDFGFFGIGIGIKDSAGAQCFWDDSGLHEDIKRIAEWAPAVHAPPVEDYPPFPEFIEYWREFENWRGDQCEIFNLGIAKVYTCTLDAAGLLGIDGPTKAAFNPVWGLLFRNVRMSSTEDRKGLVNTHVNLYEQPAPHEGNGVAIVDINIEFDDPDPTSPVPEEYADLEDWIASTDRDTFDPWYRNFDVLYFAHMLEDTQLTDILQNTYVPKQNQINKLTGEIIPYEIDNNRCEIMESRTNPGDDLYGEEERIHQWDEGNIEATINYVAETTCTFTETFSISIYSQCREPRFIPDYDNDAGYCTFFNLCDEETEGKQEPPYAGGCDSSQVFCKPFTGYRQEQTSEEECREQAYNVDKCNKDILTATNIEVGTPLAEHSWKQLVAADMSIFKKFYPAFTEGSPLESDEDLEPIPAEAYASYDAVNATVESDPDFIPFTTIGGVETYAGAPIDKKPGENARIYFPYIGGIQKHFLTGIQCALRPQIVGCPEYTYSLSDIYGPSGITPGGENAVCELTYSGTDITPAPELLKLIGNAASWANVPVDVLFTAVRNEGCGGGSRTGGICAYSDTLILQYSDPGAEIPNCYAGAAAGPLQFYESDWPLYAEAVNDATGEGRDTNICNIKDSIYAAALLLAGNVDGCFINGDGPASSANWDRYTKLLALTGWAGGCSHPKTNTASSCQGTSVPVCGGYDGPDVTVCDWEADTGKANSGDRYASGRQGAWQYCCWMGQFPDEPNCPNPPWPNNLGGSCTQ